MQISEHNLWMSTDRAAVVGGLQISSWSVYSENHFDFDIYMKWTS